MILRDRDLCAAFYGRAAFPLTETKSPLLHSARDDGDSSRYHPIYLRNTKRVVPRDGFSVVPPSFIFIRSTLGSLTQATPARPTSISVMQFRKELPYFLFAGSQYSKKKKKNQKYVLFSISTFLIFVHCSQWDRSCQGSISKPGPGLARKATSLLVH